MSVITIQQGLTQTEGILGHLVLLRYISHTLSQCGELGWKGSVLDNYVDLNSYCRQRERASSDVTGCYQGMERPSLQTRYCAVLQFPNYRAINSLPLSVLSRTVPGCSVDNAKTALLLRKSPSKSRSHIQMNLKYILWDCIWRERERGRKVKRCVCGRGGGILSLEDLWGFTKHLNNVQDVMQRNIEDPKWKTLASMYRP